jgi:DNA-binding MarR family transcriptional regulator
MANAVSPDDLPWILRETIVGLVRLDDADLTLRQIGVFLKCYLDEGGHTVRNLAAELNIRKPAITRALDRLEQSDLARRIADPRDRRSVLVERTFHGAKLMREMRGMVERAAVHPVAVCLLGGISQYGW